MRYPSTTHTYSLLEVSESVYEEIKKKLLDADYGHAINASGEIDMHGIALIKQQSFTGATMPITRENIDNWFTYHAPSPDDTVAYEKLRSSAREMAKAIIELTPPSADQSAAIRLLRESVMTANAAIACKGQ